MPSRAARWISAIALRSNVADSRSPGCQPSSATALHGVVDLEAVEPPRGAVAAEVARVGIDARARQQLAELVGVLGAQLLLHAVGSQRGDAAAHVQARLVDRVADRIAGVAADGEHALLRHERAHVPDRALDHDPHALHRDPAARGRIAAHDDQPAAPGRGARLARVAVDGDGPGHDVLGQADARVPVHAHGRALVHAGAVVADVAVDVDLDLGVDPDGDRVRAARVRDAPPGRRIRLVQALVEVAQRRDGEIDRLDRVGDRHHTLARSQEYTRAGSGSQTSAASAPGSTAIARYSDAIATQSSFSAITAGLHAIGSRSTAKPSAVPTANV